MKHDKIKFHEFFCVCNFFFFSPVTPSFSPLSVCLSLSHPCLSTYLLLPLLSLFLSFSLPSLSSPSPTPTHVSLFIFLSPLSLLLLCGCLSLPPLSLLVSFSLPPCLSSSVDSSYHNMYYKGCGLLCAHKKSFNTAIPVRSLLSLSLSLSRSCLSFSLPLLSLFSSFSLSPIPVSLFLPSLSFYLSRIPVSLPISISLSLFLSPAPISLFIFLSLSHSCLSSYLSLSHPVSLSIFSLVLSLIPVSFFFLTLISFSRYLSVSLSLSPIPVSLSLSPIPISLSPTPVSLSIFSPIPVVFLSFSHSRLPFYLCLIPVSPSPSLWFSFFHPYLSSYLSLSHRCLIFSYRSLSLSHASLSLLANMSQSCRMVSTVLYFYYITLIIYILYYLDFKILSFVRDSSYDMYYKGCGLLCAHKKSFNTAIPLPVRSLGPYMYVHYSLSLGRKRT